MTYNISSGIKIGDNLSQSWIYIRYGKRNLVLCSYLYKRGIVSSYVTYKHLNRIKIFFSIYHGHKSIYLIKKLSNPGRRRYVTYHKLCKIALHKKIFLLLSTNRGIMDNREAISNKIGGELLYYIKC